MPENIKGRGGLAPSRGALPRPGTPMQVGKFIGGPCAHCDEPRLPPVPGNPALVLSKIYGALVHAECAEDARLNGKRKK